jgi:hypothetical protein
MEDTKAKLEAIAELVREMKDADDAVERCKGYIIHWKKKQEEASTKYIQVVQKLIALKNEKR